MKIIKFYTVFELSLSIIVYFCRVRCGVNLFWRIASTSFCQSKMEYLCMQVAFFTTCNIGVVNWGQFVS